MEQCNICQWWFIWLVENILTNKTLEIYFNHGIKETRRQQRIIEEESVWEWYERAKKERKKKNENKKRKMLTLEPTDEI